MESAFDKNERLNMFEEFFHILDQWMTLHEDGINLSMILEEKGYREIAVYGMGNMATHIVQELKDSPVNVSYIIENTSDSYYVDAEIKSLENDELPKVDMIIYTYGLNNVQVRGDLYRKTGARIYSLAEVIFNNFE